MYAQHSTAPHKFSLNCLSKQIKQHYFTPLFLTVCGILSTSALAQSNQTQAFYLVDANGNHLLDANGQKVAIYTMPSNQGTALGQNAQTKNDTSTAIGKNANASTADNAVAVGINTSSALSSVAVGNNAKANGKETVAIGLNSESTGWRNIAIGYDAKSTAGDSSTAVGNQARATGWGATAYGTGAKATATNTNAIGNQAEANGALSTSLGTTARANGYYSTALGTLSNADAYGSIGSGLHSYAKKNYDIAIGGYSLAEGAYSIAQGYQAAAMDISGTSVGIQAKTDGGHSTAIGRKAKALAYKSTALGSDAGAYTENSLALGQGTIVGADQELINAANDYFNKLAEYHALERVNSVNPNDSKKAVVEKFKTEQLDPLKAKYDAALEANKENKNSTGIGVENKVTAKNTQVLGNNVTADIENSVYLGNDTTAVKDTGKNTKIVRTPSQTTPGETEVTIEQGNTTTGGATGTVSEATINGVTYGNFAGATAKGGLSVGAADNERRIMNVAAGEISKTSTDAINGSQLYAVMNAPFWSFKVDGDTTNGSENMYIGNELVFKAGSGITLTRTGKELTINSTAQAGAGTQGPKGEDGSSVTVKSVQTTDGNTTVTLTDKNGDQSFVVKKGEDGSSVTVKSVQTTDGNTTVTLTDKNGDKSFVVKKGEDGLKKEIKAGLSGNVTVEDKGTHYEVDTKNLVNVNQFNNVEQRMTNIEHRVNKVSREMRGIGANVAAGISLPQAFLPGKTMIAASAGTYKDASAVAVGYSRVSDSGNVTIKFTGTANSVGDISGGVGMGYQY